MQRLDRISLGSELVSHVVLVSRIGYPLAYAGIVQLLSVVEIIAARVARGMEVSDPLDVILYRADDISLHDLHVVDIVEKFHPRAVCLLADRHAPCRVVALIARVRALGVQQLHVQVDSLLFRQLDDPHGRRRWHARFLKLPLAGVIITRIEVARFARTLGTLLNNGVPLLKALSIVKDSIGNQVIADGIERVAGSLKEGQSLAEPLAEAALFPPFAIHMIRVGEETGRLEDILLQVAKIYDRETRVSIKRALALLEPVLILVLGVIIAAVIISILMAILGINQLVI